MNRLLHRSLLVLALLVLALLVLVALSLSLLVSAQTRRGITETDLFKFNSSFD